MVISFPLWDVLSSNLPFFSLKESFNTPYNLASKILFSKWKCSYLLRDFLTHRGKNVMIILKWFGEEDFGSCVIIKRFATLWSWLIWPDDVTVTSTVSPTDINRLQGDLSFRGNSNIYFCTTTLAGLQWQSNPEILSLSHKFLIADVRKPAHHSQLLVCIQMIELQRCSWPTSPLAAGHQALRSKGLLLTKKARGCINYL